MKANELRIGNWLKFYEVDKPYGEEYFQIESFSQNKGKMLGVEYRNGSCWSIVEILEPIPLTEEWLLKFGFTWFEKKWKDRDGMYLISNANGIGLRHNNTDDNEPWEVWLLNCNYEPRFMPCWIKDVHQLQNLYFALTGNELTIKD